MDMPKNMKPGSHADRGFQKLRVACVHLRPILDIENANWRAVSDEDVDSVWHSCPMALSVLRLGHPESHPVEIHWRAPDFQSLDLHI